MTRMRALIARGTDGRGWPKSRRKPGGGLGFIDRGRERKPNREQVGRDGEGERGEEWGVVWRLGFINFHLIQF